MVRDRGWRGLRRREAIALFGLLAGMASAALLTGIVAPREAAARTSP